MKRKRRSFSENDLKEIWRRWRSGDSISEIGRALGRKAPTIFGLLAASGGIAPRPRTRSKRALSAEEREEISRGLAADFSFRRIANQIGRAPLTVSREVNRNGGRGRYRAATADVKARERARRPKPFRLRSNKALRSLVRRKLDQQWSPEQIAGWLKLEYPKQPEMRISHEAIYRALYIRRESVLDRRLLKNLRARRAIRRSKNATTGGQARGQIVGAISIHERPDFIEDRAEVGHWEGDLITGSHNTHIATLVDRCTRSTLLVRIPSKDSRAVTRSLSRALRKLPPERRRSLTWDRGPELAKHAELTLRTGVPIYFCDPRSPWQRGTNENTNGLLRQYFPKGTRLDSFSQRQLDAIATRFNNRPRKSLGFRTPAATLHQLLR